MQQVAEQRDLPKPDQQPSLGELIYEIGGSHIALNAVYGLDRNLSPSIRVRYSVFKIWKILRIIREMKRQGRRPDVHRYEREHDVAFIVLFRLKPIPQFLLRSLPDRDRYGAKITSERELAALIDGTCSKEHVETFDTLNQQRKHVFLIISLGIWKLEAKLWGIRLANLQDGPPPGWVQP